MGRMNLLLKIVLTIICLNLTLVTFLCIHAVLFPLLEENPCFDIHESLYSDGHDAPEPVIDEHSTIERFRNGLRFKTVCWDSGNYERNELLSMINFIQKSYPVIHSSPLVHHEVIAKYSLLYEVKGKNGSLPPYLLLAHLDVVPTENQNWRHPPFSADVEDGFVYGRGAIDDKHNLFGILESLELLLKSGYKPERTFYISFGHDEECHGSDGASEVAKVLQDRKIHFEFVLDEGMMVVDDIYVSVNKPVAHIAVSEKGYLSLKLSVNYTGGHSSMPEKESSIGILARATVKLNSDSHPSRLGYGIEKPMLEAVSYHTNWPLKVIFRNIWFFKPLLSWIMSLEPSANAIIRTTTAVTMFNSGVKENVIPTYVEVVVNHRIHSSQTVDEILEYDRALINDDRVKLKVLRSFNPVRPSCYLPSCSGYQVIKETIRGIWKNAAIIPAESVGNTDSRFYKPLADNVYRFTPILLKPSDIKMIHGEDERISIDAFKTIIKFYYSFYLNVDKYHIHFRRSEHQEL